MKKERKIVVQKHFWEWVIKEMEVLPIFTLREVIEYCENERENVSRNIVEKITILIDWNVYMDYE